MSGFTSQQQQQDDEEEDISHDNTHQRRSPGQNSHDSGISGLGSDSSSSQDSLLVTCLDAAEMKLSKGHKNSKPIRSSALKTSQVSRKIRRVRWADLAVTGTSSGWMTESLPASDIQLDPVSDWFNGLRAFYQPECTCALQHKSIIQEPELDDSKENRPYSVTESTIYRRTRKAHAEVSRLQKGAHGISTKFAELCLSVEKKDKETLVRVLRQLLGRLIPFLRQAEGSPEDIQADLQMVRQSGAVLLQSVIFDESEWEQIRQLVAVVGHYFVSCVDKLVRSDTRVLSDALQSSDVAALRLAARSLPSIGGDFTSDCVESLVSALKRPEMEEIWSDLMNSLTYLCSTTANVQQFHKMDGFQTVCDILCKKAVGSREAVGLLAQVTTFWADNSEASDVRSLLEEIHLNELLTTLRELVVEGLGPEDLLLVTVILSNLTGIHRDIQSTVVESRILGALAAAGKTENHLSFFIYEQVIALMVNLASAADSLHFELVAQRALDVINRFLQTRPPSAQDSAEARAWNRTMSSTIHLLERMAASDRTARRAVEDSDILPLLTEMADRSSEVGKNAFRLLSLFEKERFSDAGELGGTILKIPRVSTVILS